MMYQLVRNLHQKLLLNTTHQIKVSSEAVVTYVVAIKADFASDAVVQHAVALKAYFASEALAEYVALIIAYLALETLPESWLLSSTVNIIFVARKNGVADVVDT